MKHLNQGRQSDLVRRLSTLLLWGGLLAGVSLAQAQSPSIVMASTTSTEQSGLFSYLLPEFKKATGIDIKVVALGTGQAIDMGRRGDADVLFVHDQVAEEKVVAEGFALKRLPVMYNDFVIIGPAADPAKVKGQNVLQALQKLQAEEAAIRNAPVPEGQTSNVRPPAPDGATPQTSNVQPPSERDIVNPIDAAASQGPPARERGLPGRVRPPGVGTACIRLSWVSELSENSGSELPTVSRVLPDASPVAASGGPVNSPPTKVPLGADTEPTSATRDNSAA
jgi:hypothetical protein